MNNTHALIVLVLLCFEVTAQRIHYVKENHFGNGTSWEDASGNLNKILQKAKAGDQIWVAKGTYRPTENSDRNISFIIPEGIKLFGGFAGNENFAAHRDAMANITILTGEIGEPTVADNSYNVVYSRQLSPSTLIDGFTITRGNADAVGPTGDRVRCGGGWYNDGTRQYSNPTIKNCIFIDNYARDGAGMYNNGRSGQASPVYVNCTFIDNKADLDGGGLYNDGRNSGKSNPKLKKCTIENNRANYGAGLFNYGRGGMSSPILSACEITRNLAFVRGGAMLNMDVKGISLPLMEDCTIAENEASVGEGIYQFSAVNGEGIKLILRPRKSTKHSSINK